MNRWAASALFVVGFVVSGCGQTPPDTGPNGSGGSAGQGAAPWRSSLYPQDWTPGFVDGEGRGLQDFSYAGFRYGEAPAPDVTTVIEVVGADPLGTIDSTAAIQAAIDTAAMQGGAIVHIPAGLYRIDGLLLVSASHVILRGDGPGQTRLYFTKSTNMTGQAHLSFSAPVMVDTESPLVMDAEVGATSIAVKDVSGYSPGDDVTIGFVITPEFIAEHNMTGTWMAFNDSWQTFFRRTIVSIDKSASPPKIELDIALRYPIKLRDQASVRREKGALTGVGVESIGLANAVAWDDAWTVDRAHVLAFTHVMDAFVRDVQSFESPNAPTSGAGAGAHLLSGGILIAESKRVTVEHTEMALAQNRGGGGNGYLFEILQSNEVLIADSKGTAGRHNFIQNWGFGTTGCVWLRVESREGRAFVSKDSSLATTGHSELHHSLATANLIDTSLFDDGFSTINRQGESTGAGITGTMNVIWNVRGTGTVRSMQYGWGYVIGTSGPFVVTESPLPLGQGTEPVDFVEGLELGSQLDPPSLYEDQRRRRGNALRGVAGGGL
jgi:hypothetical protein